MKLSLDCDLSLVSQTIVLRHRTSFLFFFEVFRCLSLLSKETASSVQTFLTFQIQPDASGRSSFFHLVFFV
jgi:hypothetical protein